MGMSEETVNNEKKTYSPDELCAAVEAILFTMGDAVAISDIAKALDATPKDIQRAAARLSDKYGAADSGVMIRQLDDALQLSTKPEQFRNLIRIAKVPKKVTLSDSVLETLSIIAYKQPVTKAEVEQIRGVSSEYAFNKLLEYDLIRELDRKDAPGRPILFGTTQQFLRSFGVRGLEELPEMNFSQVEEFKEEAEKEVDERLGI